MYETLDRYEWIRADFRKGVRMFSKRESDLVTRYDYDLINLILSPSHKTRTNKKKKKKKKREKRERI